MPPRRATDVLALLSLLQRRHALGRLGEKRGSTSVTRNIGRFAWATARTAIVSTMHLSMIVHRERERRRSKPILTQEIPLVLLVPGEWPTNFTTEQAPGYVEVWYAYR